MNEIIRKIDLTQSDLTIFRKNFADCIVLTYNNKILLQQRSSNKITAFGGHIEKGETVLEALARELNEELGAIVDHKDSIFLGAVTEGWTDHSEIVHLHFWHDKKRTITGCYEEEAIEFDDITAAVSHPDLMDYVRWGLQEIQKQKILEMKVQDKNER